MSIGFSVAVIDEDGTQQLHITEVKAGGLACAKGTLFFFLLKSEKQNISIPNMLCVVYCIFRNQYIPESWNYNIKYTKNETKQKYRTITTKSECHNSRGYVRDMWKLDTYFWHFTLNTQTPGLKNTWSHKTSYQCIFVCVHYISHWANKAKFI